MQALTKICPRWKKYSEQELAIKVIFRQEEKGPNSERVYG